MKVFIPYSIFLFRLGVVLLLVTSCEGWLGRYDDKECDYTVQIRYDYNRENTVRANEYGLFIRHATTYIFDANHLLYAIDPVTADECTGEYVSEFDLPPGRYSLITVGNQTTMSEVSDNYNKLQIGVTHREDLMLTLRGQTITRGAGDTYNNCGRLYHAYRTFTIAENDISRIRVDMVHSHCVINYTIRWRGMTPPDATNYYVQMRDVPSKYNLMPQFIYPEPLSDCEAHDGEAHDTYPSFCDNVVHHIPTVHNDRNILTHRSEAYRTGNEIKGSTITYRLRNAGQTMLSLHTGATRGDRATQVMKEIHINHYLTTMGENLDHTLKQEYDIIFEIDPGTGLVHVYFLEVGDWDEGEFFN